MTKCLDKLCSIEYYTRIGTTHTPETEMEYAALEIYNGYWKILWTDGSRLIVGEGDVRRIRADYFTLPVFDRRES